MKTDFLLALVMFTAGMQRDAVEFRDRSYEWVKAIDAGKGREEKDWTENTWPRTYGPAIVLNDTLWMIGSNFTWTSQNGKQWIRRRHNGGWGERYGSAHVIFDNRIWILGGMKSWDRFLNDVWSSPDGIHWTLVTAKAHWSERRGHAVLVHAGRMWLIGGAESSGKADVLPVRSLADVWSTADGTNWERVTSNGPWSAEFSRTFFSTSMSAHVAGGKLWIVGGPGHSTVWSSENGLQWTVVAKQAPWKGRYARGSAVFDELLWVFGGENLNDVWLSKNGREWTQLMEHAPWSPRAPYTIVVYQDKVWMYGGKSGRSNDAGDDVWYLRKTD